MNKTYTVLALMSFFASNHVFGAGKIVKAKASRRSAAVVKVSSPGAAKQGSIATVASASGQNQIAKATRLDSEYERLDGGQMLSKATPGLWTSLKSEENKTTYKNSEVKAYSIKNDGITGQVQGFYPIEGGVKIAGGILQRNGKYKIPQHSDEWNLQRLSLGAAAAVTPELGLGLGLFRESYSMGDMQARFLRVSPSVFVNAGGVEITTSYLGSAVKKSKSGKLGDPGAVRVEVRSNLDASNTVKAELRRNLYAGLGKSYKDGFGLSGGMISKLDDSIALLADLSYDQSSIKKFSEADHAAASAKPDAVGGFGLRVGSSFVVTKGHNIVGTLNYARGSDKKNGTDVRRQQLAAELGYQAAF